MARTKTLARNLKVGNIAFLPYWGKLLKSEICSVSGIIRTNGEERVSIHYKVLSEPAPRHGNLCIMNVNRKYEVWSRNRVTSRG